MKSTSLWRRRSLTRTSLNIMLFLLVLAYALCARSPLALSAESEPTVSLPGGVPPQAPELLAAATPAPADMLLHIRIYLQLRDKQAAEKMIEDLHNAASPNYHKWLNPQKFDEMFGPLQASYEAISAWLTNARVRNSTAAGTSSYDRAGTTVGVRQSFVAIEEPPLDAAADTINRRAPERLRRKA